MPRYQFKSPFSAVFGDLHHGVNASVEGLEDFAYELHGVAVELREGQFLTTDAPIVHAFLQEVDGACEPVAEAEAAPEITPPITPETPPESPTDPAVAPEGAEQNTEVQS